MLSAGKDQSGEKSSKKRGSFVHFQTGSCHSRDDQPKVYFLQNEIGTDGIDHHNDGLPFQQKNLNILH